MVGWVTAGIAFLIAAFASSGELLIRASEFRGQRRSSRRYLRLCLGYVLGNGLAAAVIAAILHIVVVPTGSSMKLHPAVICREGESQADADRRVLAKPGTCPDCRLEIEARLASA